MKLSSKSKGFGLLVSLLLLSPWRSVYILALLVAAGLAEGMGIATILPLMGVTGIRGADSTTAEQTQLDDVFSSAFEAVGFMPGLVELLVLIVAVFWVKAGLLIWANIQVGYAKAQLSTDLRLSLLRALTYAQWSYFTHQPAGAHGGAMGMESTKAAAAYTSAFKVVTFAIQGIIYLGIMLLLSWQVTAAGIISGVAIIGALHKLIAVARQSGAEQSRLFELIASRLVDALNGIKPLKAMAREGRITAMLEAETSQLNLELRRFAVSAAILIRMAEPLLVVILCFGIYFALTLLGMKMAVILVAAVAFYRAVSLLTQLQSAYQNLVVNENFVQRVMTKIHSADEAREHAFGSEIVNLEREIRFDDVSFKFGEGPVLQGISIEIPARKFTSIVGPSGSGKSTLIDQITGLYRPDRGHIEIDDVPLDSADIRDWRRKIGYVPQELNLFNDTIFANVALKDPNVTEQDVERALRQAGAWRFVSALSDGIHAQVGERGTQVSGGERQRISLARALLGHPQLLILDEPTTALDPDTEREICATLKELSGTLTVLAVSHQPALMEIADVVYRLTNGVISSEASASVVSAYATPTV